MRSAKLNTDFSVRNSHSNVVLSNEIVFIIAKGIKVGVIIELIDVMSSIRRASKSRKMYAECRQQ